MGDSTHSIGQLDSAICGAQDDGTINRECFDGKVNPPTSPRVAEGVRHVP
jgi:hypothetical protein